MKFGEFPVSDCHGAILAHSVALKDGKRLKKGCVLDEKAISLLAASQTASVVAARLEADDVHEDIAAKQIAAKIDSQTIRVDEASTGRVNFFAKVNGLFRVNKEGVDAINAIDPAITLATLPDFAEVNEGRMIATVKIIPYALGSTALKNIQKMNLKSIIDVISYAPKRIGMISTVLPSLKRSVMDKTRRVLEQRLVLSNSRIIAEERVEHSQNAVVEAIGRLYDDCDIIILFGASAISDIRDIIPSAIRQAGGRVIRFGMPVDPGNLLLLAELNGKPVIGAPGCARSPADNGFDRVLQRLLADLSVNADDLFCMGVGGLLMETGSRPHPREKKTTRKSGNVAAIILAAGQSRRMGEANKLLATIDDVPLVKHVALAACESSVASVHIVTGYEPEAVGSALSGLSLEFIHNQTYTNGLSSSLKAGIRSLPDRVDRVIVLLGDMPFISRDMIECMMQVAHEASEGAVIVATHNGKRGNPVIWPRSFFDEISRIEGDVGAKHIIEANAEKIIEVELGGAASLDLDTPSVLAQAGGKLPVKA